MKDLHTMLDMHMEYFLSFDKVIVYYDYGQMELNSILKSVFSTYFNYVEFRKADDNSRAKSEECPAYL